MPPRLLVFARKGLSYSAIAAARAQSIHDRRSRRYRESAKIVVATLAPRCACDARRWRPSQASRLGPSALLGQCSGPVCLLFPRGGRSAARRALNSPHRWLRIALENRNAMSDELGPRELHARHALADPEFRHGVDLSEVSRRPDAIYKSTASDAY
jgi:hypothetical protein